MEIIEYKSNGNVNKFSQLINVSQQKLNRLFLIDTRTGKYPTVPSEVLTRITEMFVEINAGWLLTGKGKMTVDNKPERVVVLADIEVKELEEGDVIRVSIVKKC